MIAQVANTFLVEQMEQNLNLIGSWELSMDR